MKMTSAYANKMLRNLDESKQFWRNKEDSSCTYVAAINEEPVIPEYDYSEVAAKIAEIDEKIVMIKHALNLSNANAQIPVGDGVLSVDMILIKMSQLNRRKGILEQMRGRLPKARLAQRYGTPKTAVPEYLYINYDLATVERDYVSVSEKLMELQMALDHYNQTVSFDVNL
ncbi:MAG: hypothetical protein Q4B26_17130 [Eubacteriales bacterium]|nr:hypothetical protein [Eubacteriales bacterium]